MQQAVTPYRNAAFAFVLVALTACGQSPLGANIVRAIQYSVAGQPDAPITRELVSNLPYASVAAKIGKGPRSLLILWRKDSIGDLLWISADAAALVTREGRVVKTAGLPENLRNTRFANDDPVAMGLHTLQDQMISRRTIDLDLGNNYGVDLVCEFQVEGQRDVEITEIVFQTILVRERCSARTLNWSFTNLYWVDPADGFVWRSRQHIARSFPPVVIETLKPASM